MNIFKKIKLEEMTDKELAKLKKDIDAAQAKVNELQAKYKKEVGKEYIPDLVIR